MSEAIDRLYKEAEERLSKEKDTIIARIRSALSKAKQDALKA